jgi:4-methyl-5(b-hydroxyethyl)-thiazole monophosphate biosynthesis
MKAYILLATGFEETEALIPCDIMRRAGCEVEMISTTDSLEVTGAHGITVKADKLLFDVPDPHYACLIYLPGGMPGTMNLASNPLVSRLVKQQYADDFMIAAACAAPLVFGRLGLLEGRKATCYPGFEHELKGATCLDYEVIRDGRVITACGAGACHTLGAVFVDSMKNEDGAGNKILEQMMYNVRPGRYLRTNR